MLALKGDWSAYYLFRQVGFYVQCCQHYTKVLPLPQLPIEAVMPDLLTGVETHN